MIVYSVICRDRVPSSSKVCAEHYFQGSTDLRNDFKCGKLTVQKVGYSKESDMPKLDMRGSTVYHLNRI